MRREDLLDLAERIVIANPTLRPRLPVVEKELLHLEILAAMQDAGLLAELTFKGGTCLRLCYNAPRLSEDLDFSGGAAFDAHLLADMEGVLRDRIARRFGLELTVTPPRGQSSERHHGAPGNVRRWTARVVTRTFPGRDRVETQRIKIEVDNRGELPDDGIRQVRCRYEELAPDFVAFPVRAASLESIRASKMVAYPMSVLTRNNPRHRDAWDLTWFDDPGVGHAAVIARAAEHAAVDGLADALPGALRHTLEHVHELIAGAGFSDTMARFLPAGQHAEMVVADAGREAITRCVRRFCADLLEYMNG